MLSDGTDCPLTTKTVRNLRAHSPYFKEENFGVQSASVNFSNFKEVSLHTAKDSGKHAYVITSEFLFVLKKINFQPIPSITPCSLIILKSQ